MFNFYIGIDPITGKKKRTTRRGFKSRKEAQIALAQLRLEVNEDGPGSVNELTFRDVYELWIKQHKLEVKPTTIKAIQSKFKRILPKFGHLKIANITNLYCQKVINEWATELKTFNDYKIQANLVFKYAMKYGLIQRNPMEYVTIPKLHSELFYDEDEEKGNFFTKDELQEFLKRAKEDMTFKNYTLFRLLAVTGLRKGEALALHWSDIDFTNRTVFVRKTLAQYDGIQALHQPKTINSRRIVEFNEPTLSTLQEWQNIQRKEYELLGIPYSAEQVPVFTRFDKDEGVMKYLRLASPNESLYSFFNKHTDLPRITVHGLRHTHASHLCEAGVPIKATQARLGHKDIQTTMNVYTHVSDVMNEKATATINNFLNF